MKRRTFLVTLAAASAAVALKPNLIHATGAQDVEYLRALEDAQRLRPRTLTSRARIAPAAEPGTPMVITGRVFDRDGRTPMPCLTVFAYHTDARGEYDVRSNGPHSWRLKGWVLTDKEGRFEFTTIRPAPYPGRSVAAHVHITIEGSKLRRRSLGIQFAGDPLITREDLAASAKAGAFGSVLPVVTRNGVEHVDWKVRISDEGVF